VTEREIFVGALQIEDADGRRDYLHGACRANPALRHRVEGLLQALGRAGDFLQRPAANGMIPNESPSVRGEAPGDHVGPYKLLEQIGEGGMGLVFMAEQERPVRRKVALKVLKPGLDTRQVVARFEAERQALALMDHPHIARIHDAGTTESGRPYFVMELVRGVPITEFCDERRFTPRERLELFVLVCRAVQHAHQKRVIHRDLKPSNILITLHDTISVPKIIDFGIAKATAERLTERTLFTRFAQMMGTPLYMSPEQAEMNGLDVDTRSDVYSLGVLLYELLTGTTPFEAETLKQAGIDEMRRFIREEEPPAPSRRLSTLGAKACSTVSERRGADGRRLVRQLRGELDWVVMRALEKDRNRRYESAGALAADVQRYLADEPVEACPPSAGYRLRKYWRRNRAALTTAGLVATALFVGTAVSIWQAVRATDAQHRAEADRDRAVTAEGRAATEAAISRALNDFLQVDLLRQVNRSPQIDHEFGVVPDLTVKEALDRAAAQINPRFQDGLYPQR
jgi:serine/threonine protein kinase